MHPGRSRPPAARTGPAPATRGGPANAHTPPSHPAAGAASRPHRPRAPGRRSPRYHRAARAAGDMKTTENTRQARALFTRRLSDADSSATENSRRARASFTKRLVDADSFAAENSRRARAVFTPALQSWPDFGVYQLWIDVPRPVSVRVGALGTRRFPAGNYVYTGRAARGLRARVRRHACGAFRLRWHIDYLLAAAGVRVRRAVLASANPADECRVNRRGLVAGWNAVPRFGASDCRAGCPGHLWRAAAAASQRPRGGGDRRTAAADVRAPGARKVAPSPQPKANRKPETAPQNPRLKTTGRRSSIT